MHKYSLSFKNVRDPYAFLAELIIFQALYDIRCYYTQDGTKEELESGKDGEKWIKSKSKYFRLYAGATGRDIVFFQELCIHKIEEIKKEAENARRNVAEKNKSGQMGRSPDTQMVSDECGPNSHISFEPY